MTIETETDGEDFAAFEARMAAGEPDPVETPEEIEEQTPEVNDELELTDEDELVEDEETDKRKPRSKSARERIDELTAARRSAERERDELRAEMARLRGEGPATPEAADTLAELEARKPNADDFEFGEADPNYLEALTDWKVDVKLAKRESEATAKQQQEAARETFTSLDTSWTEAEARGAEKYDDFAERVEDFKANAPCPPLMAVAIQASPVAEDVTYHLASNHDEAELIATMLATNPAGAAERFGRLEGQFMTEKPKHPGANAHPLDLAMHAGRLEAYLANKGKAPEPKPQAKIATDAPEPARHSVRGGAGRFSVDDDTNDFAAFERKHMKRR